MTRITDVAARARDYWRWFVPVVGARGAFTWRALPMLVPGALAIVGLEAATGFSALELLLVAVLCVVVILALAVSFHIATGRARRVGPMSGAALLACWTAIGLAIGGVRVGAVLAWTTAPPDIALRLGGSVLGAVVWIPTFTVVHALLAERKARLDELSAVEARLLASRAAASTSASRTGALLVTTTRRVVEPYLQALVAQLRSMPEGPAPETLQDLGQRIRAVSSNVVRAASHRIDAVREPTPPAVPVPSVLRQLAGELLRRPIQRPWGCWCC